jgi:hypothetical protein
MKLLKSLKDTKTLHSQIFQIAMLITIVGVGSHFFLNYLKRELPLPDIKQLEERVRLKKKV